MNQVWEDYTPEKRREIIARHAQESLGQTAPKFRTKTFTLTSARDRRMLTQFTDHTFGSTIKSLWVCDWSGSFTANLVLNHTVDRDIYSGLPLRKNMCVPLAIPVADACLEFVAQPGVTITIAYSDSEDIDIGSIVAEVAATSYVSDGNTFSQSKKTVGSSSPYTILCAASGSRGVANIRNNQSDVLYIGSDAELDGADYKDVCQVVEPGKVFRWKNAAEIRGKFETGSKTVAVMEQVI